MRAALAIAILVTGCIGPPVEVPSAVIQIAPSAICEGDGYATPITLDGSSSSGHLTLVPEAPDPNAPPLRFAWRLEGSDFAIDEGALDDDVLVVRAAGDRPLHVSLTVDDGEGGIATSTRTVAITRGCEPGASP